MSFQASVLKVMIASPEDVSDERKIVTGAMYRWNDANASTRRLVLLPVKWEIDNTPPIGVPAQTVIHRQLLDDADIVIGIFGTRTGTPTKDDIVGTIDEIKRHVAAGKTAKVYFSEMRDRTKTIDQNQYALIQKFRDELNGSGLSSSYESLQQFREEFEHHLALEINHPRYRWLNASDRTAGFMPSKPPAVETQEKAAQKTPVKPPVIETPVVDEVQKSQVDDLLRSVGCIQRDLLRFLLLKGGIARADVVARSRTTKNALEMNGLCGPLEQNRLLTRTPDHKYGYSTLAVSERMMDVLPHSLFPREEDDPPFFEGI